MVPYYINVVSLNINFFQKPLNSEPESSERQVEDAIKVWLKHEVWLHNE